MTHTEVTDVSMTSFYASHMITAGGGAQLLIYNIIIPIILIYNIIITVVTLI